MWWLVLTLFPSTLSIAIVGDKKSLIVDGEDCEGDNCSLYSLNLISDENFQDSLFIKETSKLRLFRKCPLWSSGSNNHSNVPLDKLIEDTKNNKTVLLVDFYADWCGPCRAMDKNLAEVSTHYRDMNVLTIRKVNVDEEHQYNRQFDVTALPTLIFIAKGRVIHNIKGVIPPDKAIQLIDRILETL